MGQAPIDDPSRIPALDGIRGLAIALVLLYHFTWFGPFSAQAMQGSLSATVAGRLALSGWMGVDLFFVLSGFLITGILLKSRASPGYFRQFYLGRALRIFPPYYLFLAMSLLLLPVLPAVWQMAPSRWAWLAAYLTNYQIGLHGWSALALPFQHFWSLAIEEQFYLAWPLLVFLLTESWLRRACIAIIGFALFYRAGVIIGGHDVVHAYTSTLGRSDELAAGALLALSVRRSGIASLRPRFHAVVVCACLALLGAYFAWRPGLDSNDALAVLFLPLVLMPLFTSLIALSLSPGGRGALRALFSMAWLRLLGRYSYSLYIVHQPVMLTLVGLGAFDIVATHAPGSVGRLALQYLLPTLASLALAMASWYLLEARMMRLRHALRSTPAMESRITQATN